MNFQVAMAGPIFAQAKTITLPTQFADIISFAIIAVLAGCSVTAMIKIGMGFIIPTIVHEVPEAPPVALKDSHASL